MKLILVLTAVAATLAKALVDTPAQDIPSCLSTCMTPFPGNHEPDTCSTNWRSNISSCIDQACSVSISSPDNTVRTTMFFAPEKEYSCQHSMVPGQHQDAPSLQLQPGVCAQSPYAFRSFFLSYGQNTMPQSCVLDLFDRSNCVGQARNMSLGNQGSLSGQCMFGAGQSVMLSCGLETESSESDNIAAHNYLTSLCSTMSATATSSVFTTTNSTLASTTIDPNPTSSTVSLGNSSNTSFNSPTFPNMTLYTTAPITPSAAVSGPSSDASESEKVIKRNSAAQWALVVVMFARSLMF